MNILDILAKDPDQAVEVANDKDAKMLLCQIGIAGAFSDERTLSDRPTVQICGFDGHRTHFIIALLFSGLPFKKDNGYLITCAPRSAFDPKDSTEDIVKGASQEQSLKGLHVIRRTLPKAGRN